MKVSVNDEHFVSTSGKRTDGKNCVFMIVFDKPLDEMEMKIKGTASKKKEKEGEEEGEIQIGDTCGVFIPDWNRWIRCLIKAKDKNGAVYVWVRLKGKITHFHYIHYIHFSSL